jgi:hypothetical protein
VKLVENDEQQLQVQDVHLSVVPLADGQVLNVVPEKMTLNGYLFTVAPLQEEATAEVEVEAVIHVEGIRVLRELTNQELLPND